MKKFGVTPVMGATRIPTRPASTEAITQLTPAWKSALKPSSVVNRSFSAPARVAIPKRVKRNSTHNAAVMTMTVPSTQRRVLADPCPQDVDRVVGEDRLGRLGPGPEAQHHRGLLGTA